ncbi:hypothetical protein HNP46_000423 [Pseudomonas nitritireducens]|uniref:Uncharacterized protein n=1 Tax=Pseudomonas nitroreducens TaxID=46680 RepID=A0A7W7KF01_PSENT|nr:hypothetical protein [Pseudomonas nitritireducens]MBB4861612.1 hypothetical protein [Pseudomonas nitritireducens]
MKLNSPLSEIAKELIILASLLPICVVFSIPPMLWAEGERTLYAVDQAILQPKEGPVHRLFMLGEVNRENGLIRVKSFMAATCNNLADRLIRRDKASAIPGYSWAEAISMDCEADEPWLTLAPPKLSTKNQWILTVGHDPHSI